MTADDTQVSAPANLPSPSRSPAPSLLPIIGIFVFALLLRLWNITWALPNATRFFSYHPDESMVTSASLGVNPFLLRLDTQLYAYGALPMLLNGAVIHAGEAAGLVAPSGNGIPSASALLAARMVTAILGAATCGFLYGVGRIGYGRAAGLIAAGFYALAPLAVQHGHFATVDVPATFFVSGALYFAVRATQETAARPRDLLWAGVWAGLAAAAKYNGGLVLLAGIAAWWVTRTSTAGKSGRGLAMLLGGVLAAFLIGCPTVILNPSGVIEGIREESLHVRSGHGAVFAKTPPGLIYHVGFNLAWGLTLPLLLCVLVGVVAAIARRGRAEGVMAAFALPYYLLIGLAQVKFARYTLPLFPVLVLWTGALVPLLWAKRRPWGIAAGIVFGVASVWALLFTAGLNTVMGGPDPRDEAAAFVRSQPAIRTVAFARGPWFFSPAI